MDLSFSHLMDIIMSNFIHDVCDLNNLFLKIAVLLIESEC